jgi:aminomethyltransferase
MTVVAERHADHGATFTERGGRRVVDHYGRPARAARAVRNGVGVLEMGYGVVVLEGADRIEFVDNAVTTRVPTADGEGRYALLLEPEGQVRTDMYVYNAGERLLVFTPPETAADLVDDWAGKTFIQDVAIRNASTDFGVFGVHGPSATEKIASVLNGASAPEPSLTFVRGSMGDEGVTVVATDAPTGEEGYEVFCAADAADRVFDTLLTHGLNAAPFGYRTYDDLTLEAGTPLFETELAGRLPNVTGTRAGYDLEKGCFVGQEVVSRVANRGRPSRRLVGLQPAAVPAAGATVYADPDGGPLDIDADGSATATTEAVPAAATAVGEITRATTSPTLDRPIAFALVEYDLTAMSLAVAVEDGAVATTRIDLPFVDGSATSARLPTYT